jgi:hypothetical protein
MTVDWDASYTVCPRCGFVRRSYWAKPLIHKGRKPLK